MEEETQLLPELKESLERGVVAIGDALVEAKKPPGFRCRNRLDASRASKSTKSTKR